MRAVLLRLRDDGQETLGTLAVYDDIEKIFECKTLELPWNGNKTSISCIPRGMYHVSHRNSPKHKDHLLIEDVVYRSSILVHVVNYVTEIEGCVGVGKAYADINGDGVMDITSSRNTLKELVNIVPIAGMSLEII
jgi:hypothetical protein